VALYLAAAGVGRIGLVDYDVVDFSNLQRQVIHGTSGIGELKVESARKRMLDLNPDIQVEVYNEPFTSLNAMQIAESYDLIIDGTDNFPTRYLTNDLCVLTGKPNVYGSIFRFDGQVSVFDAKRGPVLSLSISRAAAARPGALLRRGWCAGRAARHHRLRLQGHRSHQADLRHRRHAHRQSCCYTNALDMSLRVRQAA